MSVVLVMLAVLLVWMAVEDHLTQTVSHPLLVLTGAIALGSAAFYPSIVLPASVPAAWAYPIGPLVKQYHRFLAQGGPASTLLCVACWVLWWQAVSLQGHYVLSGIAHRKLSYSVRRLCAALCMRTKYRVSPAAYATLVCGAGAIVAVNLYAPPSHWYSLSLALTGLGGGWLLVATVGLVGTICAGTVAMGDGDGILVGATGAVLGFEGAVVTFFGASLIGLGYMLILLAFRCRFKSARSEIAFFPPLCLAAILVWVIWPNFSPFVNSW